MDLLLRVGELVEKGFMLNFWIWVLVVSGAWDAAGASNPIFKWNKTLPLPSAPSMIRK